MENKLNLSFLFCLLFFSLNLNISYSADSLPPQQNFEFEEEDDFFEEEDGENTTEISDPLSWINRPMYIFNDKIYIWVLRPVIVVYKKTLPKVVRGRVTDFFSNLGSPLRIVANGLQGDLKQSVRETGCFLINSTVGLGGLFSPATRRLKIQRKSEDFGQVFGKWGIGSGAYIHLPLLGPTNVRDGVGSFFNGFFSLSNYFFPHNLEGVVAFSGLKLLDSTSALQEKMDSIKKEAIDPYSFSRDAWVQWRESQVKQ